MAAGEDHTEVEPVNTAGWPIFRSSFWILVPRRLAVTSTAMSPACNGRDGWPFSGCHWDLPSSMAVICAPTSLAMRSSAARASAGSPRDWTQRAPRAAASISSAGEQDFIYYLLGDDSDTRWIGLSDKATEGTFAWSSGEPVTYTKWRSGEPNNASNAEDCAEYRYSDGNWNDNNCSNSRLFVCEFPPPVLYP